MKTKMYGACVARDSAKAYNPKVTIVNGDTVETYCYARDEKDARRIAREALQADPEKVWTKE